MLDLQKWAGPVFCLLGLALLGFQIFAYFNTGMLSSKLIGSGVALLAVGGGMIYYYIDDRRSGWQGEQPDEEITPEEYDQRFQEMFPDEDNIG